MTDSILLRFLSSGLINVGGDDAKFAKLQATSADLVAALKRNPEKASAFSLIAFDPEAPTSDPVVLEALDLLKSQWPTYVNTFAGVPIGVLRALLLDALVESTHEDERVAVAFAASARNVLPFMEIGNEQSIWDDAVRKVEASVDRRAEREWATPEGISVGDLKLDPPTTIEVKKRAVKVDKTALLPKLAAVAGPNPHWPTNPQPWAQAFAPLLTDALAQTIDTAVEEIKVGPIDVSTTFKELTSVVSAHINAALTVVSGATAGLQRRTNLIWWKQALFSPSAQASYRSFPRTISAALMALDLYEQIPMFSPASVSSFLEEAVRSIENSNSDETKSLSVLLKETSDSASLSPLRKEAADLYSFPIGRCTITALMAHPEKQANLNDRDFRDLIGVSPEIQLKDAQWATWIFRDLQAGRATKEAPRNKAGKVRA